MTVERESSSVRWEIGPEASFEYAEREGLVNLIGESDQRAHSIYTTVDPTNTSPYKPEWDDLVRLHRLVRKRRVINVLEFGCGHSSLVLADALAKNKSDFGDFVTQNIRRSDPFHIDVVDDIKSYLELTAARFPRALSEIARFHHSQVEMTEFNSRICTRYITLPNICPDLIYLDGPSQHSVLGDIAGISTRSVDRMPMASDILRIEHFLLPGTLVVIDGRTANARFLATNLQRNWTFTEDAEMDVHYLELTEPPLGPHNRRQIEFCLAEKP